MPRNYSIKDTIEQEKQKRLSTATNTLSQPIISKIDTLKESTVETIEETFNTNIYEETLESLSITEPSTSHKNKGFFARLFNWK